MHSDCTSHRVGTKFNCEPLPFSTINGITLTLAVDAAFALQIRGNIKTRASVSHTWTFHSYWLDYAVNTLFTNLGKVYCFTKRAVNYSTITFCTWFCELRFGSVLKHVICAMCCKWELFRWRSMIIRIWLIKSKLHKKPIVSLEL